MVELIVNQWSTNGNIEHSRKLVKSIGQKLNLYLRLSMHRLKPSDIAPIKYYITCLCHKLVKASIDVSISIINRASPYTLDLIGILEPEANPKVENNL